MGVVGGSLGVGIRRWFSRRVLPLALRVGEVGGWMKVGGQIDLECTAAGTCLTRPCTYPLLHSLCRLLTMFGVSAAGPVPLDAPASPDTSNR